MRIFLLLLFMYSIMFGAIENLKLQDAISLLKKNNSEIKIAKLKEEIAKFQTKIAKSYNYGMLNFTFDALRSNDAGNVFGFKLKSREATFGDFGFDQFLAPMGQALMKADNPNQRLTQQDLQNMNSILSIEPNKLNYPDPRNHFQSTLTYKVPLFTGFKLTQYEKISKAMEKLSHIDTKKIIKEKIYQTKKTFYDITLVENFIKNLQKIKSNIDRLEDIIRAFKKEGYAKDTDVLEVEAKKAQIISYLNEAKLNRDLAYEFLEFLIGEKVNSIVHTNDLAKLPNENVKDLVDKTFDMQKVRLGLKITDMNVKLKKSGFYPTVGAFGEYGSSDDKPFNDFFDKDSYTFGAQLKWNLFNGGKTSSEVQKAKIKRLKMLEQLKLAKDGLALKIRQIITQVKSKDFYIKAKSKELKLKKRIYKTYEEKYKEGLVKISDVLIKNSEELKALMELLKVKTKRNEKVFKLESLLDKGE